MANRDDLERLVGRLIMDDQFRNDFFAAVNRASSVGTGGTTKISADNVSVDLTAKQVELAQQFEKKCLKMLLTCMNDTNGDLQEAW